MHKRQRQAGILGALAALATAAGLVLAPSASASTTLVGPECAPNVVSAVLANIGISLSPGQSIQYLQITTTGQVQLCVVTVPAS